jgi:hypothetical protein
LSLELNGDITLEDLRIIGYRGNSDGIDFASCARARARDCFIRTADDNLVAVSVRRHWSHVHPPAGLPEPDLHDVEFSQCILWQDRDGPDPIHVGWSMWGGDMYDLRFRDIDILHTRGGKESNQIAIHPCWWGQPGKTIHEVLFEDIRAEDAQGGPLFLIAQLNKPQTIRDIRFRNIHVLAGAPRNSVITVHHPDGTAIENITFENVEIYGRKIRNASESELEIPPRSTRSIQFR